MLVKQDHSGMKLRIGSMLGFCDTAVRAVGLGVVMPVVRVSDMSVNALETAPDVAPWQVRNLPIG
jgi:hypothetical protein